MSGKSASRCFTLTAAVPLSLPGGRRVSAFQESKLARPLFVAGPSRSGTTALIDYLNQHDEVLICMERYKFVNDKVDPSLLTFERILDYEPSREGETDVLRERHIELLGSKNPSKLKWIGDKGPGHARRYKVLSKNNPGAHFIITYRPIEEVVESFEDRAKNLDDPWIGGKDGLKMGVAAWNRALQGAREYLENDPEPNGLILNYHDFFYRNEECIPLISRFLEIEFDDSIREAWASSSRDFETRRRKKEPMTEEKAKYIEENKDHDAEAWILERIERQWSDPGLYKKSFGEESGRRSLAAALIREKDRQEEARDLGYRNVEQRAESLEAEIESARKRAEALLESNRKLEEQMNSVRNSRIWKLLSKLHRLQAMTRGSQ